MRLMVVSHKVCWRSDTAASGFATDGGFAMQIGAISELFDHTTVCVPVLDSAPTGAAESESPFRPDGLTVEPLPPIGQEGTARRRQLAGWLTRALPTLTNQMRRADAVHAPIPGDIGTIGMLMAHCARKPLYVRHCGNWAVARTRAERFWRWYMVRYAGGRRVMRATGGNTAPPDPRNSELDWLFSSSLWQRDIDDLELRLEPLTEPIRLVTVGRQEPYKGTATIIDALPLLSADRPDIELHIVGDGSAVPDLEARASKLGVGSQVVFHGTLRHDGVLDTLIASDVFVFPTAGEGFPKAVAEALTCGLPVVTSPVSVLPTLIPPSAGELVEGDDPRTWADAISRVLDDGYVDRARSATEIGGEFTLDRWRDSIGATLTDHWGPLKVTRTERPA